MALLDALLARAERRIGRAELPAVLTLGVTGAVTWRIRNQTGRRLRVALADELAPSLLARNRRCQGKHVATPTGLDVLKAAALYGARHTLVASVDELRAGLESSEGTSILEVRTDRAENVALHRRVWEAVAAELS